MLTERLTADSPLMSLANCILVVSSTSLGTHDDTT